MSGLLQNENILAEDLNPPREDGIEASAGRNAGLPEGWKWRKLGELCHIALGRTPSRDEPLYWGGANPWATISDLNEGLLTHTTECITDLGVSATNSKPAPTGTLLMSFKLSIGKMAFAGCDLFTNEAIAALHLLQPTEVDKYFLYYALKAQTGALIEQADNAAKGKTLNKAKLQTLDIPIPSFSEQRRIVEYIDAFAQRVEEVFDRLNQLNGEFNALCRSIVFDTSDGDPIPTPMHELVRLRAPDVDVKPDEVYAFAGVKSFGRGVFKGPVKSGAEFAYPRLTRLNAGEFVYPKLMAWEGALGIVPPECDGLVVSTEFPVFQVNQERVLPETLDVYFRSPSIWPMLSEISTGTNARRKRLHPSAFLAYEMPLPPMKTQLRMREMKRRVDELRRRHAQQRIELEKLMPAVLDRAFRGEL